MSTAKLPWFISVDDHVIEPPDLFQTRLPAKFREKGPKIVRLPWKYGGGYRNQGISPATSGPETDFWQVEDIHVAVPMVEIAAGFPPEEVTHVPIRFADIPPGCYQVKERLLAMDAAKIERSLCFPNSMRFAGQLFLWLEDRELGLACVRAYNDFIVEEWAGESGGRLLPLCVIPLWDAGLAAEEIRRNAARGVRAVTFSELPSALGLPSIHDKDGYWHPLFRACEETGMVICMHIGSSSTLPAVSPDAPSAVRQATVNFNAQLSFTEWMLSGLLLRFPNLKLAFSESQIGWIPYVLERMDRIWSVGNAISKIDPAMTEPPSTYMEGRVWGCFFSDNFGILNRDAIGITQITLESDYPHQDSTWPHTYDYLSATLAGLPYEDAYKIARGNAIQMLDLEPDPSHVGAISKVGGDHGA